METKPAPAEAGASFKFV